MEHIDGGEPLTDCQPMNAILPVWKNWLIILNLKFLILPYRIH